MRFDVRARVLTNTCEVMLGRDDQKKVPRITETETVFVHSLPNSSSVIFGGLVLRDSDFFYGTEKEKIIPVPPQKM